MHARACTYLPVELRCRFGRAVVHALACASSRRANTVRHRAAQAGGARMRRKEPLSIACVVPSLTPPLQVGRCLDGLLPCALHVACHPFGNYVLQQLLEVGEEEEGEKGPLGGWGDGGGPARVMHAHAALCCCAALAASAHVCAAGIAMPQRPPCARRAVCTHHPACVPPCLGDASRKRSSPSPASASACSAPLAGPRHAPPHCLQAPSSTAFAWPGRSRGRCWR
jgi:hypothetical protein